VKKHRFLVIGILLLSLLATASINCSTTNTDKINVVTSTSLLGYITQQIGDDRVEVINLIPPAQHPGNFNIRPGDVETLASANLFLLHGWPGEGYADKFIASANNPKLTVIKATVDGNWMIPSVQSAAVDKVAAALSQIDSKNASAYSKSANQYKQKISAKESEIKNKLQKANVAQINIIASQRQADFLKWAEFNVVANYAGPNALNPQTVKELVDKGKAGKVTLIVDNLQDGKDAGKAIAEELGAKQINLSNFPGGYSNTEAWEKAIDKNIELLLGAITK
jgi:ABC-type Zn uptake system ZnuABC Zn-binding protein ZnuA